MRWDDMNFWRTGEWQVIQEHLEDLRIAKVIFNPAKQDLFNALDLVDLDKVKVAIIGQEPYTTTRHACGVAFSVPDGCNDWPDPLKIILQEYSEDLHYPAPTSGNLTKWCTQGVLLWNAIPSVQAGKSMSHAWTEWEYLTTEIVQELAKRGIVFVFVGSYARRWEKYVTDNNSFVSVGFPSVIADRMSKNKFSGSRLFSTINAKLNAQGLGPVDWKL